MPAQYTLLLEVGRAHEIGLFDGDSVVDLSRYEASMSNESVATFANGVIMPLKEGMAHLTFKSLDDQSLLRFSLQVVLPTVAGHDFVLVSETRRPEGSPTTEAPTTEAPTTMAPSGWGVGGWGTTGWGN